MQQWNMDKQLWISGNGDIPSSLMISNGIWMNMEHENVGRKGPFLLIIYKIQALQVPIGEGHIHMFVQSDFSLVCGGVFGNFLTLRIAECWSCPLCFALIQ